MDMTTIPANAAPIALLNKLGIKVKPSGSDDIALPEELGNYLDQVIQNGNLYELNELIPSINKAVVNIGKTNPVVILNALIASDESSEAFFQTASSTLDPKANVNYRHLANLAHYHSAQIRMVAEITAESGLENQGMHFEIIDERKFKALLEGLSKTKGFTLNEKAKSVFNDMAIDMTMVLPSSVLENNKISKTELEEILDYLKKFNSLGLTELRNEYTGKSISSRDVIDSLEKLKSNYDNDVEFKKSFDNFERLTEPLHSVDLS